MSTSNLFNGVINKKRTCGKSMKCKPHYHSQELYICIYIQGVCIFYTDICIMYIYYIPIFAKYCHDITEILLQVALNTIIHLTFCQIQFYPTTFKIFSLYIKILSCNFTNLKLLFFSEKNDFLYIAVIIQT